MTVYWAVLNVYPEALSPTRRGVRSDARFSNLSKNRNMRLPSSSDLLESSNTGAGLTALKARENKSGNVYVLSSSTVPDIRRNSSCNLFGYSFPTHRKSPANGMLRWRRTDSSIVDRNSSSRQP